MGRDPPRAIKGFRRKQLESNCFFFQIVFAVSERVGPAGPQLRRPLRRRGRGAPAASRRRPVAVVVVGAGGGRVDVEGDAGRRRRRPPAAPRLRAARPRVRRRRRRAPPRESASSQRQKKTGVGSLYVPSSERNGNHFSCSHHATAKKGVKIEAISFFFTCRISHINLPSLVFFK